MNFAKENHLELSVVDDKTNNYFLPGCPLADAELNELIEQSRKSGNISLGQVHFAIRKKSNEH